VDIELALLKLTANKRGDNRIGNGEHYIFERLRQQYPSPGQVPLARRWEAIWTLIVRGLAYVDYSQGNWDNAELRPTALGRAVIEDPDFNPDSGSGYVDQIQASIPAASATVLQYIGEAHRAFTARCFFATAVMVGVASEAAFLEMAPSFGSWLQGNEQTQFLQVLNNPRVMFLETFKAFRKRVEGKAPLLPPDLGDSLDLTLNAVLDALRVYRNQAGHPTGKQIDRETAFIILQMAPRYLQKLYELKEFFDRANAASASGATDAAPHP